MRKLFRKLSGNPNKSFREIPTDREATYKQRWAVAWQFARECADEFPDVTPKDLAVVFNAVILKYHSDPKNNSKLTHGDVQAYLGGEKECPKYYKSLIDMKSRNENIRNSRSHSNQGKLDLTDNKQVQKFIKMYKEGHALRDIGESFGVSHGSVRNYVKKLKDQGVDIELRGQGIQQNSLNLSDERTVRRLIKMYNDGYTLQAIGDTFGMSNSSVRNYITRLKESGVDIEFRGRGARTDNKYPHKKRPNIAKEDNTSNKTLLNIMNTQKRR